MSPISHLLIAWVIANLFSLDLKERRMILIMGVISDIDGVFILFNTEMYHQYHHTFAHAFPFGIILAPIFTYFSQRRLKVFGVLMLAFTMHLVADIIGTGWPVTPLYPLSNMEISAAPYIPNLVYDLINPLTFLLFFGFALFILYSKIRTPLEFVSKKWDRIFSDFLILPLKERCEFCERRAFFTCKRCGKLICLDHIENDLSISCHECSNSDKNPSNRNL